jgi:diacylglycerol kinase (ATP)
VTETPPERVVSGPASIVACGGDGDREAGARLAAARHALDRASIGATVVSVASPDEAGDATVSAVRDGARYIVCFGDDPAIRSVVDALVGHVVPLTDGADVVLGAMGAHGSCDLVRTFGIPDDARFAAERLASAPVQPLDVVKVTYLDHSRVERTTHFAGLAEVGLGGAVVRRAASYPAWLGRFGTFGAFWSSVATYRVRDVRVTGERRMYEGPAHDVIVGNCQYGRGGIRLSPRSFPGDGFLDLLIMTGPRSDQFTLLPKMFQGEQVPDPSIHEYRARRIRVEADPPLPLQADGVALGTTPVEFQLLPHAIALRI